MDRKKNYSRWLNTPARASLWYLAATILSRGIGMLGTPIFTRLLSPEDYGVYALFSSVCAVVQIPLGLELSGAVSYSALELFSRNRNRVMEAAGKITLLSGGAFAALFLLLSRQLSSLTGLDSGLVILCPIYSLAMAMISLYTARMKYEYRYKRVVAINLALALLTPVLSIMFIQMGYHKEGRILGALLISLSIALPLFISMHRRGNGLFPRAEAGFLIKSALPLLPHYILTSLIIRFGEIMLGSTHGTDAVARFSVASSVGFSLTIVSTSLLSALGPWLVRKIKEGDVSKIRQILGCTASIMCLAIAFVCALAPELLTALATEEYKDAIFAVYPLALSVLPMLLCGVFTILHTPLRGGAWRLLPSLSAFISVALLSGALRYSDYRLLGLIILIAYSILAVASMYLLWRDSGHINYLDRTAFLTVSITVLYVALLALLVNYPLLRLALLIPLVPPGLCLGGQALALMKEREM